MTYPKELMYTKDHEWVKIEDDIATIGITDYALEQLGDVVHLELPNEGDEFEAGSTFGTIESTKTVSDLYMPMSGKVQSVNKGLEDDLDALASSPYTTSWLIKVLPGDKPEGLLSSLEYETFISEDE